MSLSSFSVNTGGMLSQMGVIGSSFASDLVRRIAQGQGRNAGPEAAQATPDAAVPTDEQAAAQAEQARAEKAGQLQKLESALSGTVTYMADKHGEKAASVMIGLVYKRLGEGKINERTLGNAFLDVTRFIDKNFGTGAGDTFMSHLNGSLNNSMNTFFDNGLNESFMVAPPSSGGGGVDASSMLEEITQQYAEVIKEMLEEARAVPEEGGIAAAYADPAQKEPMIGVMKDIVV